MRRALQLGTHVLRQVHARLIDRYGESRARDHERFKDRDIAQCRGSVKPGEVTPRRGEKLISKRLVHLIVSQSRSRSRSSSASDLNRASILHARRKQARAVGRSPKRQ